MVSIFHLGLREPSAIALSVRSNCASNGVLDQFGDVRTRQPPRRPTRWEPELSLVDLTPSDVYADRNYRFAGGHVTSGNDELIDRDIETTEQ